MLRLRECERDLLSSAAAGDFSENLPLLRRFADLLGLGTDNSLSVAALAGATSAGDFRVPKLEITASLGTENEDSKRSPCRTCLQPSN